MKYPRTYHLPFSPGATKDDKKLQGNWFNNYAGKEIVITEKLDGENIHMSRMNCYARSDSAPTRSPWSRNIWDAKEGLFWKVRPLIFGSDETIYGENLYGEHSIHYDKLTDYFYIFAINNGKEWYSWDDVKLIAEWLGIPTVPELWRGVINTEAELKSLVERFVKEPSLFGPVREGVVVRLADSFLIDDFKDCVCKWVRPNHVQTDVHWTKTWKKAELINN